MAIHATHVRFAMALEERAGVKNAMEYYSGAVYPDSRYFTGIPREETHNINVPRLPFHGDQSDFEKGWATHLYYDERSGALMRKMFNVTDRIVFGSDEWISMTAFKIIEDIEAYRLLGEQRSVMQDIRSFGAPRGEDLHVLDAYFQARHDVYQGESLQFESYDRFFKEADAPYEALKNRVTELSSDPDFLKRIYSVYDEVLNELI